MSLDQISYPSRLETLSHVTASIEAAVIAPIIAPWGDGRTEQQPSPALKQAIAAMLDSCDRLETQAKADLTEWKAAARADTRNREAHERAERKSAS
jgi:hypothetical protein